MSGEGDPRERRSSENLEKQIEEAVVAAHGPAEPATGFLTMIEGHVRLPIKVKVVGEEVKVASIGVTEDGEELVAKCPRRGRAYKVFLTEGRIPGAVQGKEWIAAYFQFQGKRLGRGSRQQSISRTDTLRPSVI